MPVAVNPITTRSQVILEMASGLVSAPRHPFRQVQVVFKEQGGLDKSLCLSGSSTVEGIHAVVRGEAAVAIVNPAAALAMAYKGAGPFDRAMPVRSIGVIPSHDQMIFAVKGDLGLRSLEDIGGKRCPLKVTLRGQADHSLHFMTDDIVKAAGFTLEDLRSWGGEARREGQLPYPDGPKFKAFAAGGINAIFDEAADVWLNEALDAGMSILGLSEETVRKLEAKGYRRAWLRKKNFPKLAADVLTIDFSGWPIFVHAEAPDALVTGMCAALDERKHRIAWEGEGPLPVERMCRDAPDTPQQVPLHPAAEKFWRSKAYLD